MLMRLAVRTMPVGSTVICDWGEPCTLFAILQGPRYKITKLPTFAMDYLGDSPQQMQALIAAAKGRGEAVY